MAAQTRRKGAGLVKKSASKKKLKMGMPCCTSCAGGGGCH